MLDRFGEGQLEIGTLNLNHNSLNLENVTALGNFVLEKNGVKIINVYNNIIKERRVYNQKDKLYNLICY